jgi:hypothetical protein
VTKKKQSKGRGKNTGRETQIGASAFHDSLSGEDLIASLYGCCKGKDSLVEALLRDHREEIKLKASYSRASASD